MVDRRHPRGPADIAAALASRGYVAGDEDAIDVVVLCAGGADAIRFAFKAVRPGGTVVAVGLSGAEWIPFDFDGMVVRDIDLIGVLGSVGYWEPAISLIASGQVKAEPLVTRRVPDRAHAGRVGGADRSGSLKVADRADDGQTATRPGPGVEELRGPVGIRAFGSQLTTRAAGWYATNEDRLTPALPATGGATSHAGVRDAPGRDRVVSSGCGRRRDSRKGGWRSRAASVHWSPAVDNSTLAAPTGAHDAAARQSRPHLTIGSGATPGRVACDR